MSILIALLLFFTMLGIEKWPWALAALAVGVVACYYGQWAFGLLFAIPAAWVLIALLLVTLFGPSGRPGRGW